MRMLGAALLTFGATAVAEAQVLRDPVGTAKPAGTARNAGAATSGDTRPPLGTPPGGTTRQPAAAPPGHTLGVGPNGAGDAGTGLSGGSPNVLAPDGANASPSPAPLSGSRPNGGSATNGAKPAPLGADGVRKVQ